MPFKQEKKSHKEIRNKIKANHLPKIIFASRSSGGDYLQQAGNNYLLGAGLGIVGGVVTFIGTNSNENEQFIYVGAGIALSGFVYTIIGHTKLIKAGKKLNENKKVSFQPSSTGIGLALKF